MSSICLNMIVKDEAHIIVNTFDMLLRYFKFSYWVICDTGSTDGTQKLINDYFREKKIPGALLEHEWDGFGVNRTLALKAAFNKSDYLLIFDADDKIEGELILPNLLTKDKYHLRFGPHTVYYRPLLINNRKKWSFGERKLHEYLFSEESGKVTEEELSSNSYYLTSGRTGKRSQDPDKYLKDALVLESEYALRGDPRDCYYCAQSYKDYCGELKNRPNSDSRLEKYRQKAIEWFNKQIAINDEHVWWQERYISCLYLGDLYREIHQYEKAVNTYLKGQYYDQDRIECALEAAFVYKDFLGKPREVIRLFNKYKDYKLVTEGKLFIQNHKYNHLFEYCVVMASQSLTGKSRQVGYEYAKKILTRNKLTSNLYDEVFRLLYKFKEELERDESTLVLLQKYNRHLMLKSNNPDLDSIWNLLYDKNLRYKSMFPKLKIKIRENEVINSVKHMDLDHEFVFLTKQDQIGCDLLHLPDVSVNELMMEAYGNPSCVAFNTWGYFKSEITGLQSVDHFNSTDGIYIKKDYYERLKKMENNRISKKEEYQSSKNILIYTGWMDRLWNQSDLKHKALGGSERAVAYLSQEFPKDYRIFISGHVEEDTFDNITYIHEKRLQDFLDKTEFHTLIMSRHISFLTDFTNIKCYQLIMSLHDTHILNKNFDSNPVLKKYHQKIDKIITLTRWHKQNILNLYPYLDINKFEIINNGINVEQFPHQELNSKVKNRFIWTSRSERGLNIVLNLWSQILEILPDATLDISSYGDFPKDDEDRNMLEIIDRYEGITHHGKLNSEQLYTMMSKAEYWLYTSIFPETSCITAMEMLMSGVICLYYPLAGLNDTIGDYGIKIKKGEELKALSTLDNSQKEKLKSNGRKYAIECSWKNREIKWSKALGLEI